MEIVCKTVAETERLGNVLGELLQSNDVVCLSGDLGAGKTALSRGIAIAQGVADAEVSSPTFSIMNIYNGTNNEVRHFDLYRLNSPSELEDIGFYEYAGGDGITLIEWAELFTSELPPEHLQITLSIIPEGRLIKISAVGERNEELVRQVEAKW